jgi:hypothetical protein
MSISKVETHVFMSIDMVCRLKETTGLYANAHVRNVRIFACAAFSMFWVRMLKA